LSGGNQPFGWTGKEVKMTNAQALELVSQIGKGNIFAISGGRVAITGGELLLKVAHGYAVKIALAANDTYTVQRVFRGKVKAEAFNVFADEVGEVAYTASCYYNRDFGMAVAA
jgi:hypothetical protein